jgi:arylsulfatase
LPDQDAEGIVVSDGGRYGGYALYLKGGRLIYENNFLDRAHETIVSTVAIPKGPAELSYEFTRDEGKGFVGGTGRLFINGQLAGEARLEHVAPPSLLGTFDIGEAHVSPVSTAFALPYRFNGSIDTVTIQLK